MIAGKGKQKGGSFEREVCKKLSLWVSNGKRDDIFWRSAMSGGRASVQFKRGNKNTTQVGDISAIDPLGAPLIELAVIECKFYRDLKIAGAVVGNRGGLSAFWTTCATLAERNKKLPVLIAKQNNTKPFICLSGKGMNTFGTKGQALAWLPLAGGVQIMWLDKFLKNATPPK